MKYCSTCGAELHDNDAFCPKCGARVDYDEPKVEVEPVYSETKTKKRDSTLMTVAFVFNIIGCIIFASFIIPLAWMIPMTVSLNDKIKNNEPISVGFKVCNLIFVSLISGILLLVGDENE